jgi:hypothetical protein
MATSWAQQLNPRLWRSALCFLTRNANSSRGQMWRIWLKMLHTLFKAAAPSVVLLVLAELQTNLNRGAAPSSSEN